MHTSVIIPSRPNEPHLAWVLDGYARQRLAPGHTMEVWIGIDGGTLPSGVLSPENLAVHAQGLPAMGAAAVRNALVGLTDGDTDLLIFGNADCRPDSLMVQAHRDAMAPLPPKSLVLGWAPWERCDPSVLDALIDSMPMIFSYCHMSPHTWYDFRCAYSLNLSLRREDFLGCGGFHEYLRPVYYEDLAFGCRLLGPERKGVWHEPAARVLHRHPLTLEEYLDREELLGLMAPVLARECPEAFARILANRSVEQITRDFRTRMQGDTGIYVTLYRRLREKLSVPLTNLGDGVQREAPSNSYISFTCL